MGGWEPRVGERATQRHGIMSCIGPTEQRRLEHIKRLQLFALPESGMVGHIVSGAGKSVEPEDRLAKAPGDENRGDGEVLIPLGLSRLEIAYVRHRLAEIAWTRPFQNPPRPRQCW